MRLTVPGQCKQGVGAVLVGADLVQGAAYQGPAVAADGGPDFAGCHDVASRQFSGVAERRSRSSAG